MSKTVTWAIVLVVLLIALFFIFRGTPAVEPTVVTPIEDVAPPVIIPIDDGKN